MSCSLFNENCLDTLKRLEDQSIDLVITSPPYNMRTRVRNGQYTTREKSEHFSKKYEFFDDALPIDDFYKLHSKILKELLRISKIVCYNFQIVTGSKEAFFKIIGDFNKQIKDIIIWDKNTGQPAMHSNILNSCYEFILIMEGDSIAGRHITNAYFKRGEMNNILRIKRGKKITDSHGAVFPEELVDVLIKAFSKDNDIVVDPFMGSGTTGKVALLNNRRFIGIELTKEYFDIAEKRILESKGLFYAK
jgi:site-specific DNA-methyltransferase (adenine-specific)/modification methylase